MTKQDNTDDARKAMQDRMRIWAKRNSGVELILHAVASDDLGVADIERILDVDPPFRWQQTVRKQ